MKPLLEDVKNSRQPLDYRRGSEVAGYFAAACRATTVRERKHQGFIRAFLLCLTAAALLLMPGCSDSTTGEQKTEAPAKPVTGRVALFQMFNAARGWSPDVQVLELHSIHMSEVKSERGKAAAWQATFVSPQSARARSYTYSVIEGAGNLHKGVFAGLEEGWSGHRGVSTPFIIAALKTDSNEVLETALKNPKVAEFDKKNADKPISFVLEKTDRFPDPAWRVLWGETVGTSSFSVFMDASTGAFLQIMR